MTEELAATPPEEPVEDTPQAPAALAGPHAVYRRLRTEGRIIFLPAATTLTSGGADLLLNQRMMETLHTSWTVVPVALGAGSLVSGVTTGLASWVLARTGDLDPINLKRVLWGSVGSGAVLTLFGGQPLVVGGYLVLATIATAAWHKARWKARRALHRALLAPPPELPAGQPAGGQLPKPVQANAEVVDADAAQVEKLLDEYIRRWQAGVATDAVPGSRLTCPARHPEGRTSFIVDGGPKGLLLSKANAAREQIGSALRLDLPDEEGVGGQDVVFDQPGGIGLNRGQLRMQVINLASSTAKATRVTDEIPTAPGKPYSVRIGHYLDDGTPAYWDLADDIGVWSGAVVAGTGMGKSSMVDALIYRARRLGFHVLYLDPDAGASSQIMAKHATYPALGLHQAEPALRFLTEAADFRKNWLALHPAVSQILPGMVAPCSPGGADPDPGCPCGGVTPPPMLAVIEECDLVFGELLAGTNIKLGEPYGKLAKRFRKLGMGFVTVTQLPDIKAFGNSDMLRSSVAVRNLLAMHVTSNTGGNLIPGLPYSPKLLPRIIGRALMCGQTSRKMQLTLDWLPRRDKAHLVGEGPFAEDLFEELPEVIRHPADVQAAGRWLPQLGDATMVARTQARAAVAAMMVGASVPLPADPTGVSDQQSSVSIPTQRPSWPGPVCEPCPPPTAEELEAMLNAPASGTTGTLADRVLAALADTSGDQWLTFADLARRIGRLSDDAGTVETVARARELSAELAAAGWEIRTTRRAAGLGATVADLRAALETQVR